MGKEEWLTNKSNSNDHCQTSDDLMEKTAKKILDKFPYADLPDKNGVKDGKLSSIELEILPRTILNETYKEVLAGDIGDKYRLIKEKDPHLEDAALALLEMAVRNEAVTKFGELSNILGERCATPVTPQSNAKRIRL